MLFVVNPRVFASDSLLLVSKSVFLLSLVSVCLKAVGVLLLLVSSNTWQLQFGKTRWQVTERVRHFGGASWVSCEVLNGVIFHSMALSGRRNVCSQHKSYSDCKPEAVSVLKE